jgi:hypothetical protein
LPPPTAFPNLSLGTPAQTQIAVTQLRAKVGFKTDENFSTRVPAGVGCKRNVKNKIVLIYAAA